MFYNWNIHWISVVPRPETKGREEKQPPLVVLMFPAAITDYRNNTFFPGIVIDWKEHPPEAVVYLLWHHHFIGVIIPTVKIPPHPHSPPSHTSFFFKFHFKAVPKDDSNGKHFDQLSLTQEEEECHDQSVCLCDQNMTVSSSYILWTNDSFKTEIVWW